MIKTFTDRNSLFLMVRSHPQIQYHFQLGDSHRAANQGGILLSKTPADNVAEIHPIGSFILRRRG